MAKRKSGYSDLIADDEKELLKTIAECLDAADVATKDDREAARDDLEFLIPGNQWPAEAKSAREGRPCLEVDRLNPYINQVVNEQRENRPAPQVNPTGDGASRETADILQGMLRHIMYVSDGDVAVDTAYDHMVKCSRGFMRVTTEYENETSFNQQIRIKRIQDPIDTVFLDPSSSCPVASDAEWGAIVTWLTRDAYEREYPKSKLSENDSASWGSIGVTAPEWVDRDGCRVVEYFVKEREAYDIVDFQGQTIEASKIPSEYKELTKELRKRTAYRTKVMWYKVNAIEVLDKTEWPGKYIPIVPVYGSEHYLDGKTTHSGLTRSAKDPARLYNVFKSAQAEMIALAPKSPILAAEGSLVNKPAWRNVHRSPQTVLEYAAFDDRGNQNPPPSPIQFEPPIQAISAAMMGSEEDIKAVTGMWNPSMGVNESGQSGVAIRQLQRQGQVVNYHYVDNLSRSIRHLGRILIDLIPKIYDVPRVIRIVKPDQTEELVKINQPTVDGKGIQRIYDLSAGEYDVTVSVGPSYQTKRQEQLALLESLMQGPLGQLIAAKAPDLIASMLDFDVAKDLQERLAPPGAQGQGQIPPELQQQIEQGQQLIQQLQQEVQRLQQGADVKIQTAQMDAQIKAQQGQMDMQIEAEKAQMEAQLTIQKAQIDAQTKIETAKIQAQADIYIAQMRSQMELESSEKDEAQYNGGAGMNAGPEE